MEEEFAFIVILGIIFFFIWNSSKKPSGPSGGGPVSAVIAAQGGSAGIQTVSEAPVPLEVIQAVIEKFQSTQEDMVPLETLYFKTVTDGQYDARFMFMNTRHFFGQQFDVRANIDDYGSVTILKTETTSDPISYTSAYLPDTYQSYNHIDDNFKKQFESALTVSRGKEFQDKLNSSLMTRASLGG